MTDAGAATPDDREGSTPGRIVGAALLGGPLLAAIVGAALATQTELAAPACWTAAITVLCAVWWIFEPVPLPATSLVPLAALPLTGVLTHKEAAMAYGHHLVLLMLAGSIVASAMEKSGAHRRVALGMVSAIGAADPKRLVLGFLVVSASLSMWMSNTATTVMLLPVALAVVDSSDDRSLSVPVLLAVAYGASIGGSATPIGTPPNLIFMAHYVPANGEALTFLGWMRFGLPVVVVMVPIAWWWLTRSVRGRAAITVPALGPWRSSERRVLVVFGLTALAWMTRAEPFGGWSAWLDNADFAGDSTVAVAAAVLLFVLPSGDPDRSRLLDWQTAVKIPWGVFIMIGGGIAIGKAFGASELGPQIGHGLAFLSTWPLWVVVPAVCALATFITEVTSNTAAANVLMPILAAAALAGDMAPLWLMLPAVLGLNHAFMLPVATAPNAIVYGTGRLTSQRMAREGLVVNLLGVVVITVMCALLLG
ncbi:MAG: SLC13 family permease [Myxococcota bacterium]